MKAQRNVHDALRTHSVPTPSVAEDAALPASLDEALQAAWAAADVVFAGVVIAVERREDVVSVRFAVVDGVRGASTGGTYTLREWSGLWNDNASRYAVGQHLLMLLHAPSVAGFASPVIDGAIPLTGDATTGSIDLRWIALHVAVTDTARLRVVTALRASGGSPAAAEARMRLEAMESEVARSVAASRALLQVDAEVPAGADTAVKTEDPNARVDQSVVMDMLHAWQRGAERAR